MKGGVRERGRGDEEEETREDWYRKEGGRMRGGGIMGRGRLDTKEGGGEEDKKGKGGREGNTGTGGWGKKGGEWTLRTA